MGLVPSALAFEKCERLNEYSDLTVLSGGWFSIAENRTGTADLASLCLVVITATTTSKIAIPLSSVCVPACLCVRKHACLVCIGVCLCVCVHTCLCVYSLAHIPARAREQPQLLFLRRCPPWFLQANWAASPGNPPLSASLGLQSQGPQLAFFYFT